MRILLLAVSALIFSGVPSVARAQMTESTVTASNGVVVTKNVDEFAGRREHTSPRVQVRSANGALVSWVVARIGIGDKQLPVSVQGFIIYYGGWRHFDAAVFRGGSPVNFKNTGKEVGSCRNGCQLTETFTIEISPEEVAKHAENGRMPIQIRSQGADTVMLDIPVSYIEAVIEIAK